MQVIKHGLTSLAEVACEQLVKVCLVAHVNSGDCDGAAIAVIFVFASISHGIAHLAHDISFLCFFPISECWVSVHVMRHPNLGWANHLGVDAVLHVLLHVSIQEEIERGQVAEWDVFSEGGSLFWAKRIKKSPVKITDFFLSDGGKRVDWVKPDVEPVVFGQLFEASVLKLFRVFDSINCFDKTSSQGKNIVLLFAEVVNVSLELISNLAGFVSRFGLRNGVSQWAQSSQ